MKKQWVLLFGLSLFMLCSVSASYAAVFEYYGGGINSRSDSYVENLDTGAVYDGPVNFASGALDGASESLSDLDPPLIGAYGDGGGFADLADPFMAMVGLGAGADAFSETGQGYMESYGRTDTAMPGQTPGIFFQITPGQGEALGQAVNVVYFWSAYLESYHEGAAAILDGGQDGPDMSITVNEFSSSNPSENRVWAHAPLEISDDVLEKEDMGMFTARTGDIIGLHLGAMAEFEWLGLTGDDAYATASMIMGLEIQAVPAPGSLLLLGAGLIGLLGIRTRA